MEDANTIYELYQSQLFSLTGDIPWYHVKARIELLKDDSPKTAQILEEYYISKKKELDMLWYSKYLLDNSEDKRNIQEVLWIFHTGVWTVFEDELIAYAKLFYKNKDLFEKENKKLFPSEQKEFEDVHDSQVKEVLGKKAFIQMFQQEIDLELLFELAFKSRMLVCKDEDQEEIVNELLRVAKSMIERDRYRRRGRQAK